MAVQQRLLMRVIFTEADIRKVELMTKPDTVDLLIDSLKDVLQINYNFSLQFKDPNFDNELCNLTEISELPERPTLKIIPVLSLVEVPKPGLTSSEELTDTPSEVDTDILSDSSQERQRQWPEVFDMYIPKFSVDVEYRLRQANLLHLRDGTHLIPSKELKHDILERLAETIYALKAYPTNAEFEAVASALVRAHPCLKEQGSVSGWSGWKNSLKFKMGNYRTKMRQLGHHDVTVNGGKHGKHSLCGDPPNKSIKKPRRGEVNYLPDYPDGQDDSSLEDARQLLVDEMKKKTPNGALIKQKMDLTFALRRSEVVKDQPAINQICQRWPALLTEQQVCLEFSRVVGKSLRQEFYEALDRHSPRLMEIFKAKRGLTGQVLADLMRQTKASDVTEVRCLVLRGLPVILGDDPSTFFKASFDVDDEGGSYNDVPVGILCREQENITPHTQSLHHNASSVGIILEGNIVMDVASLPQAMYIVFGLTYALHLNYPKYMKNF
ncbi:sterile alpha motif domain-containing protein 3-like [Epinephelus moara]|uniref:sterile alpha motif domain-containing protein 3-like n=1 Tax=Epinephelus moara TaxID=300413 RepID=UPI00214E6FBD|nr:sterile alpha motif domain-containing protein 3-like [Epinephelus moara]